MRFCKTAKTLSAKTAFLLISLLGAGVAWAGDPGGASRSILDSTGTTVVLPSQPQRVVTLIPALGELAADFLGNDLGRIVGVSEFSDYPPALEKKESIGPYTHFNLEKVATLKPDLILASSDGNNKDQILHLREMGIPVVVVSTEDFKAVGKAMELVGEAMGDAADGKRMAESFGRGLERIRAKAEKKATHPRVLVQLDDQPLIVAAKDTFLNDAVESVGAVNIYGDFKGPHYPKPALEDVLAKNPDVIIVLSMDQHEEMFRKMARRWEEWGSLSAVRGKRVRLIDGSILGRPTPRLLEGLSLLEKAIYE